MVDELIRIQNQATMPIIEPYPMPPMAQPVFRETRVADPWQDIDEVTDTNFSAPVAKPISAPQPQREPSRRSPLVALLLLGLLVMIGGFTAYKLVFESKDGTLIVEVESEADVRFKNGNLEIYDEAGKLKYTLAASEKNKSLPVGKYLVKVTGAEGVMLETDSFEMSKNGRVVLRVTADAKIVGTKVVKAEGTAEAPLKAPPKAPEKTTLIFDVKTRITVPSLKLDLGSPLTFEGYFTQTEPKSQVPITLFNRFYISGGKVWSLFLSGNKSIVGSAVALNQRTHLAGVYEGESVRLFINGKLAGELPMLKEKGLLTDESQVFIGYAFIGTMEEVRISSIARYNKEFVPEKRFETDKDTLALYHFDEGEGDVLKDSSGNKHDGKIIGAKWVKVEGTLNPSSNGDWVQLFNGKDLSGWEGIEKHWRWQDGALVGTVLVADAGAEIPHTNLCGTKKYQNFELKFQVRLKDGKGNSGVQIHSEIVDRMHFGVRGPQGDIGSPGWWGGLFDQGGEGVLMAAPEQVVAKTLKPGDFNDYYIKCVGKRITIKLNGATTVDADFPTLPTEGIIAWQLVRNEGPMEVSFKNIAIRELPPTPSPDPDRRAAEWVLSIVGGVKIRENGKEREIKVVGDLPRGAFELADVDLNNNPKVSDADLACFKDCKNLTELHLQKTKVTAAGVEELKKALPKCKIAWDGGVIEGKKE